MANKTYDVVAFDSMGNVIYSERVNTLANARKVAREFIVYANVYTVDVMGMGKRVNMFVKTAPNSGVCIDANGNTKGIRF